MHIDDRLEQLERANKRLKRAGAAALALFAMVVLPGQARESKDTDLAVRSLVIRDRAGRVCLRAGTRAHGLPFMSFHDKEGTERIALGLLDNGFEVEAYCSVNDAGGRRRILLRDRPKEGAEVALFDEEGLALLLFEGSSGAALNMYNAAGVGAVLACDDKAAGLALGADGRITLTASEETASLICRDKTGKTRAELGLSKEGPLLRLRDRATKLLWKSHQGQITARLGRLLWQAPR